MNHASSMPESLRHVGNGRVPHIPTGWQWHPLTRSGPSRFKVFMAVRMIEIYADESGKLADGAFPLLCACIADSEAWMELAKKWVGLLRRDSRSYIHMRELTYLGADELDRQLADYRDVMREISKRLSE